MKIKNLFLFYLVTAFILILYSCEEYTPKPRGYFRIDLPEKKYKIYNESDCPYSFEYPEYAAIVYHNPDSCWIDLVVPKLHAVIYLTYKSGNDIETFLEETRTLVYKHTIKADAINKYYFKNEFNAYGLIYEIKGNAASSINFYITDSISNFIRGALYFNNKPNKDSLAPVVDFLSEDIAHLIETTKWKD